MADRLDEVLVASDTRQRVIANDGRVCFTLISYRTLNSSNAEQIRHFQEWVQKKYSVLIPVVGGGYGCSRIEFDVVAPSAAEALRFTQGILQDREFQLKATEVGFRVLIVNEPWARIDLANGMVEGGDALKEIVETGGITMVDQSQKINAPVTNSNLAAHSPNASQFVTVNSELENILGEILAKAETDETVTKQQYIQVKTEIEELKAELQKPKPQKSVIERILGNLGSIASLTSLANKIAPFLPVLI
jgi:hypothetical protein